MTHFLAIAGGMMIAASYSLAYEGVTFSDIEGDDTYFPTSQIANVQNSDFCMKLTSKQFAHPTSSSNLFPLPCSRTGLANYNPYVTTTIGFLSGIGFIVLTKKILDQFGDLKIGSLCIIHSLNPSLFLSFLTLWSSLAFTRSANFLLISLFIYSFI